MSYLMDQKKKFMRSMNERSDEKTGLPYHKGEPASDEESSIGTWAGKRHYEDDPNLNK